MSSKDSFLSLEEIYTNIGIGKFHVLVVITLGLIQFFDATELILLSFLGPILNCSWKITLWESSFITSAVFLGMICGSVLFGKLSDLYGRRTMILTCVSGIFYFSLLCAATPTIFWMIFIRSIIGMFIGGVLSVIFTFVSEVMPIDYRGISILSTQLFWPLGAIYISFLTFWLVNILGWRLWLVITVLPMCLLFPLVLWLPESPRYFIIKNRVKDAIDVINRITKMNNVEEVSNVKTIQITKVSIFDIFHPNYALTTCIVFYLYFVIIGSYYSYILSSYIINSIPHVCLQDIKTVFYPNVVTNSTFDNSCCVTLSVDNMKTVLISVVGELIIYLLVFLLIKFMKRKLFLQILLLINAIIYFLLNLCLSSTYIGILLMIGRGAALSASGVLFLYASEVFPTTIRGFAMGLGNFFSRIGAMLASIIVNVMMVKVSFISGTLFYVCTLLSAFMLMFLLPYETKDRPLLQSVEDVPELNVKEINN